MCFLVSSFIAYLFVRKDEVGRVLIGFFWLEDFVILVNFFSNFYGVGVVIFNFFKKGWIFDYVSSWIKFG